jgi:hypothetical protein
MPDDFFFTIRFNPTSSRAVNNFRLPFRRWFSTVPVDRYFFTILSIVDQGISNKSEIYDLLVFFLYNFTINSLVSVLNSLLLRSISFVYNLQKGSTTDVKWRYGSRDVLFSLTVYSNVINYPNWRFNVKTKNVINMYCSGTSPYWKSRKLMSIDSRLWVLNVRLT